MVQGSGGKFVVVDAIELAKSKPVDTKPSMIDRVAEIIFGAIIFVGGSILLCILVGALIYGSFFLPENAIPSEWWFYRVLLVTLVACIVYMIVFNPSPSAVRNFLFCLELSGSDVFDDEVVLRLADAISEHLRLSQYEVSVQIDEDRARLDFARSDTKISMNLFLPDERPISIRISPTELSGVSRWDRLRGTRPSATHRELKDFAREVINSVQDVPEMRDVRWCWSRPDPHTSWRPPFDIAVLTRGV